MMKKKFASFTSRLVPRRDDRHRAPKRHAPDLCEPSTQSSWSESLSVASSGGPTSADASTFHSETPTYLIQEWHAVLADKHSGNKNRTTLATQILKEVKQEFKANNAGKKGAVWFDAAYKEYVRRVALAFPSIPVHDRGLILVQRTPQVLESGRVVEGKTYGYPGKPAIYGEAQRPKAVQFFFQSRDPPTLENEVKRFQTYLDKLRTDPRRPPKYMMDEFEDLLQFVHRKIAARADNIMARELLENVKFIPVLQKQWKLLAASRQSVPMDSIDGKAPEASASERKREPHPQCAVKRESLTRNSTENSAELMLEYLAPLFDESQNAPETKQAPHETKNSIESGNIFNEHADESLVPDGPVRNRLDQKDVPGQTGILTSVLNPVRAMMTHSFDRPANPTEESQMMALHSQLDNLQNMVQQLLLNKSSTESREDGTRLSNAIPREIDIAESPSQHSRVHEEDCADMWGVDDADSSRQSVSGCAYDYNSRSTSERSLSSMSRKKQRFAYDESSLPDRPTPNRDEPPSKDASAPARANQAPLEITVADPYASEGRYSGIPAWAGSYGVHFEL